MNPFLSEKYLVVIFCALFSVSALFLFWQNERELNPDYQKSWWILSFAAPENKESLDFTVENHTANTEFQYAVMVGKETLAEETFQVASGERKTITPTLSAKPGARTSIIVTAQQAKKEIYR